MPLALMYDARAVNITTTSATMTRPPGDTWRVTLLASTEE
jgi:hypothetical protein